MSYQVQDLLVNDPIFQGRSRSAATEQAAQFADALADKVRRGEADVLLCFVRLNAAGPGIAAKATAPDGGCDQSKITDADLLSLTQANWPTVAALYP